MISTLAPVLQKQLRQLTMCMALVLKRKTLAIRFSSKCQSFQKFRLSNHALWTTEDQDGTNWYSKKPWNVSTVITALRSQLIFRRKWQKNKSNNLKKIIKKVAFRPQQRHVNQIVLNQSYQSPTGRFSKYRINQPTNTCQILNIGKLTHKASVTQ